MESKRTWSDMGSSGQCRTKRPRLSEASHFHIFPSKFCRASMQMHDFHLLVLVCTIIFLNLCQSRVAFCIIMLYHVFCLLSCNHGTMTVAIAKKSFNQLSMVLLSVVRLALSSSCRAMHYTGIFTIDVSLLIRLKKRAGNMFQFKFPCTPTAT